MNIHPTFPASVAPGVLYLLFCYSSAMELRARLLYWHSKRYSRCIYNCRPRSVFFASCPFPCWSNAALICFPVFPGAEKRRKRYSIGQIGTGLFVLYATRRSVCKRLAADRCPIHL